MRIIDQNAADFSEQCRQMKAATALFDPLIEERTRQIIEQVRKDGDDALVALTEKFDHAQLSADRLSITTAELLSASVKADAALRKTVAFASKNIERFSRRGLRKNWSMRTGTGSSVGEKFDPFQRVGIYIPGGTAPLVSTALMTVTLARVAGCREIVVCTPAGPDGTINPALLFAVNISGATEIFRIGGAQAIAAMALGTGRVRKVQKVFGPGNAYVVMAKRMLYGYVSVDLLPGPSEVLVLADESAEPKLIAADLLAQAEHGSGHERIWLITTSKKVLQQVEKQIQTQLIKLQRRDYIQQALANNGWLIRVETLEDGISLTNQLAPEHCEIMTRQPGKVAEQIVTAGAIFLGPWSPTVLGDYIAGPSHELPTGGAGASFAGLTVDQFQRRSSIVSYNRSSLRQALPHIARFSEVEGLDAHGRSAAVRFEKEK